MQPPPRQSASRPAAPAWSPGPHAAGAIGAASVESLVPMSVGSLLPPDPSVRAPPCSPRVLGESSGAYARSLLDVKPLPTLLDQHCLGAWEAGRKADGSAQREGAGAGGSHQWTLLAQLLDDRLCASLEAVQALVEASEERMLRRIDRESRQWRMGPPQCPLPAAAVEVAPPEALRALVRSAEERSLQLVEREARERRAALRQLEEMVAQLGAHCVATAERQDRSHEQLLALMRELEDRGLHAPGRLGGARRPLQERPCGAGPAAPGNAWAANEVNARRPKLAEMEYSPPATPTSATTTSGSPADPFLETIGLSAPPPAERPPVPVWGSPLQALGLALQVATPKPSSAS